MIELVAREFIVDVPLDRAWDHLARVERWTSWAKHIKRVIGPGSATLGRVFGAIYARNLDKAIPNLQAELRAGA